MVPFHTFDELREESQDFVQPGNIETVKGSHGLRFSVLSHNANHLGAMNRTLSGDLPRLNQRSSRSPGILLNAAPV
jgi:hypothetical protein